MENLVIIARIKAKPEYKNLVQEEAIKLLEPTRKEEGCISYILHQDIEDENLFIFYEIWENSELLTKHTQTAHFKGFQVATKDALADFVVHKTNLIK